MILDNEAVKRPDVARTGQRFIQPGATPLPFLGSDLSVIPPRKGHATEARLAGLAR